MAGFGPKHLQPVSPQTVALIEQKGMSKDSPILLRIFKEEAELEIWKQARDGKFALLKSYPICRWSGELGPKIKEGDRQAPEGFYFITPELMNPRSNYYLAFNLGYPNEFDRAWGRTGSQLMVHGDCSSRGCYAMTDEQIAEIFALARESFDGGQLAFQVQAYPFRMTGKNLARHRKNPNLAFWRMLKEGNDHFEVTKQQPKIDVCEKRYVFDAHLTDPSQLFNPTGPCPQFDVPQEVAQAVAAKREADNREFTFLASIGVPTAPIVTGRDGGGTPSLTAVPAPGGAEDRTVTASVRPLGVAGSAASASIPLPPTNPRRSTAGASSLSYAAGASATSSARSSASRRGEERRAGRDATALRSSGRTSPEADEREEPTPASTRRTPPPAMPGATPIIASGGFSYR